LGDSSNVKWTGSGGVAGSGVDSDGLGGVERDQKEGERLGVPIFLMVWSGGGGGGGGGRMVW